MDVAGTSAPTTVELLETPVHALPERIVAEATRLADCPVGLYVVDLEGVRLCRVAGDAALPPEIAVPQMVGPELPQRHARELRQALSATGATLVPLWLRHRAVAALLAERPPAEPLEGLARQAAPAIELAAGYTDRFAVARRRRETVVGAELQENLLPPRIAGLRGAELAGGILPAYDVGGDWFDHAEDGHGAWLAVGDGSGKGARASAMAALAVAAFRAVRRAGGTLPEAARRIDEALRTLDEEAFMTALLAHWQPDGRRLGWILCGHPAPLLLPVAGPPVDLGGEVAAPLGALGTADAVVNERALWPGERVVLYSDGITERRTRSGRFGVEGLVNAVVAAESRSAPSALTALLTDVSAASGDGLEDDATALILAVLADAAHEPPTVAE